MSDRATAYLSTAARLQQDKARILADLKATELRRDAAITRAVGELTAAGLTTDAAYKLVEQATRLPGEDKGITKARLWQILAATRKRLAAAE